MLDGFKCYWRALAFRMQVKLESQPRLESLILRRRRTNINNGKLPYRAQGGRLVMHSYTQGVFKKKAN